MDSSGRISYCWPDRRHHVSREHGEEDEGLVNQAIREFRHDYPVRLAQSSKIPAICLDIGVRIFNEIYMKKFLLAFYLSLFITASAREWKSADGTQTFSGFLESYIPPDVEVSKHDGSRIKFKDNILSKEDLDYCIAALPILEKSYFVKCRVYKLIDDGMVVKDTQSGEVIFLKFQPVMVRPNDHYSCRIFYSGSYNYWTANGDHKVIRRFEGDLERALAAMPKKLLEGNKSKEPNITSEKVNENPPEEKNSFTSYGTAFAITNNGYLASNAHVVEGAKTINIIIRGRKNPAKIVVIDKINDIALLKIEEDTTALCLANKNLFPKLGDSVTVAGFPNPDIQGRNLKVTKGTLSSLTGFRDDVRHFQIDAAVQPGNSGGPLISDSGIVLGIVNAKLNDATAIAQTGSIPQNVNYAIKVGYLSILLEKENEISLLVDKVEQQKNFDLSKTSDTSIFLIEASNL